MAQESLLANFLPLPLFVAMSSRPRFAGICLSFITCLSFCILSAAVPTDPGRDDLFQLLLERRSSIFIDKAQNAAQVGSW